ncbi:MAG: DNA-processing protein DprA [Chloroflexi bacterium]|nr:DNA-processing protein DprA [Chloroflexota bacterium]
MSSDSLPYFLVFARIRGVGPVRLRKLIAHFGSLEAAWRAEPFDVVRAGMDEKSVGAIAAAQRSLDPQREMEQVTAAGLRAFCWDDAEYPALLRHLNDPPPVLFVRGALTESDRVAVAIVGTRKATAYGREVAAMLSGELARRGVTVVSGLARGIDVVAHEAALAAGGRTVAVLACGAEQVYPPQHAGLAKRIEAAGAVVSDYPVGAPPEPANFPPRNRIISGLSLGTVVIEADVRSGALITAEFAAEQGRDVFAVPGNIFSTASRGTNRLLASGAVPLLDVDALLEHLNLRSSGARDDASRSLPIVDGPFSAAERDLLLRMTHEPASVDELVRQLSVPAEQVIGLLVMLELRGAVRQAGLNRYALTAP